MIAVLDFDATGGRDWTKILGVHRRIDWVGHPPPGYLEPVPEPGSVLVCHNLDAVALRAVRQLGEVGVHVIIVSAGGDNGTADSTGVYSRRRPVLKPHDDRFGASLYAFQAELAQSGLPMWEILEGALPQSLIAFYLLGLIGPSGAQLRAQIRPRAQQEFTDLTSLDPVSFESRKSVAISTLSDMRIPSCATSRLKSQIAHSFVENVFLSYSPEDLVVFCREDAAILSKYRLTVESFLDLIPDGYSPISLLGSLKPLSTLSMPLRTALETELVTQFTTRFANKNDPQSLKELFAGIDVALHQLETTAVATPGVGLKTAQRKVRSASSALLKRLAALPGGTWLP